MSDITISVYLGCKTQIIKQRLEFYFDEETRPDFAEEVPESEAKLVDIFELMPQPEEMESLSDTELVLFFELDAFEMMQLLPSILKFFEINKVIILEDSMDYRHYKKFNGEGFDLLHSPEALEDEGDDILYNQNLSSEQIKSFNKATEKGRMFGLQYLAQIDS